MGFTFCSRDCFHPVGYPRTPRTTELRHRCTPPSLPLHSGSQVSSLQELYGATRAALNSPLNGSELNAALVANGLAHSLAHWL